MKLQQIHTLVAIAETGSIRAAARQLGQTQPALSKGLQQLEEEFSVPLVHRTARGVSLTLYGRAVVRRAKGIALELGRMREEIDQMRGTQEGAVSLVISPSPAILLLPGALRRFHRTLPHVQVRLREGIYPDTLRMLRDGLADIAIGAQPLIRKSAGAEFRSERLYANALVVACRTGHPKANAESLKELLDSEWLLHGPAEGPGSLYTPVFKANGLSSPTARIQSDSFTASINLLEHTDALSLLPERLIRHLAQAGRLQALHLKESMPDWDVAMITRTNSPLTPAAQKLAESFRRTPLS